jgi:hypothetical protein
MGLADQLTIARAAEVPIVAALYISHFHWHDYWATGLFCLAMGKLKTWSQAVAAAIGGLAAAARRATRSPGGPCSSRLS